VAAIEKGKDICLANKETLIAGGPAILPLADRHGIKILPADSEHSALFQCIQGLPEGGLRRIVLTASGGAFRDWPAEKLASVTVADALKVRERIYIYIYIYLRCTDSTKEKPEAKDGSVSFTPTLTLTLTLSCHVISEPYDSPTVW
jgi:hypothetical protein